MSETDEVKSNSTTSSPATSPTVRGGVGPGGANFSSGSSNCNSGGSTKTTTSPVFWPGVLHFPQQSTAVVYRRMSPEEDLIATQQGIDILVKQRSQLVEKLVRHHSNLVRSNEIESLYKFSKQIDSIMRYVQQYHEHSLSLLSSCF